MSDKIALPSIPSLPDKLVEQTLIRWREIIQTFINKKFDQVDGRLDDIDDEDCCDLLDVIMSGNWVFPFYTNSDHAMLVFD